MFLYGEENSIWERIILISVLGLFIAANQVHELIIENESMIYETKSLFPFLNSSFKVEFVDIASVALKSDQTTNERGFMLFRKHNNKVVEIILSNGNHLIIPGKVYPEGAKGFKKIIDSKSR